jgi:hypothetical protein
MIQNLHFANVGKRKGYSYFNYMAKAYFYELFTSVCHSGIIKTFLFVRWRLLRSLGLTSNIPSSKPAFLRSFTQSSSTKRNIQSTVSDKVSDFLKQDGLCILGVLPDEIISGLLQNYETLLLNKYNLSSIQEAINSLKVSGNARGFNCTFQLESLDEVIRYFNLDKIACNTLGLSHIELMALATCDITVPLDNIDSYNEVFKGYDQALRFHKDFDGLRFLKTFIYLTDCELHNGPHVYVKKTANNFPSISTLGFARLNKSDMLKFFNSEDIVVLTGCKGTSFIEDTTGFHSGCLPEKGYRIMIVIEFMDKNSTEHIFNKSCEYKTIPAYPDML